MGIEKVIPSEFRKQLDILRSRIKMLRLAQTSMGLSFLFTNIGNHCQNY